jgi:hypothetical protein
VREFDPDITPPYGTPIVAADPAGAGASVRTGPHVPEHDVPDLPIVATDLGAILQARQLFRASRLPRCDATWPHLRPHLLADEARLQRMVREDPDDDESAALLQEVRRYLGRHP